MDGLFALIFIIYILSAVIQAVLGKDVRKRQRRAGAPWPGTSIPRTQREEESEIPEEFPFPFPFPFEEVFEGTPRETAEVQLESEDAVDQPVTYEDGETVSPWEDKTWGSLGPSLEGDDFPDFLDDSDFVADLEDMGMADGDKEESVALARPRALEGLRLDTRSAIIQGIVMSEVLKRPKAFSRYPAIRK